MAIVFQNMNSMIQIVPFKTSFELAKRISKASNIILWISTALIIFSYLIKRYKPEYQDVGNVIVGVNCISIIAYTILIFLSDLIYYNASIARRTDLIDNSFGTSYGEAKSVGYYSNNSTQDGIYKLAVNGFENCFFTFTIAQKMMFKVWLKNILFAVLIISFSIFGFNNALILLLQISLPVILLQQAIRHTLFNSRVTRVYENYRVLFNDLRSDDNPDSKVPFILKIVMDYETTLTSGAILLDSRLYKKLNDSLSQQWITIKSDYSIQ